MIWFVHEGDVCTLRQVASVTTETTLAVVFPIRGPVSPTPPDACADSASRTHMSIMTPLLRLQDVTDYYNLP